MALTEKQKRFCDEYLIDLNAVQAAIRAGYSKSTARSASKWINQNESPQKPTSPNKSKFNNEMRQYIDERMAEKEKELIADQDEVMRYLTSVMRREKKEQVVVTLNHETSKYVPDENGITRKQTVKQEVPKIIEIDAPIRDANKAAELLGKAHGLFTDKVDLNADMDLNIVIDYGDDAGES
jgi:phage terminase small subunit